MCRVVFPPSSRCLPLLLLPVLVCFEALAGEVESVAEAEEVISIEIGMLSAHSFSDGAQWLEAEIDAFNRGHSHITATPFALDSPYAHETPIEERPSLPADVCGMKSWKGYEVAYLASLGRLVPIDNFLPDESFKKTDFPKGMMDCATFDGKTWGVPWASEPLVLFCDRALFEEAGREPPRSWDELAAAVEHLTKDTDGDGLVDQFGLAIADDEDVGFVILTLLLEMGGTLFDEEGVDVVGNATAMKAIGACQELLSMEGVRVGRLSAESRYAMIISDHGRLQFTPDEIARYRIAHVPVHHHLLTPNRSTCYLGIRRSSPERECASWELVKWLTRRDVSMPDRPGCYPCRVDFTERADFQARMKSSYPGLEILYEAHSKVTDIGPNNLYGRQTGLMYVWDNLNLALRGTMTVEEALRKGEAMANELLYAIQPAGVVPADLY